MNRDKQSALWDGLREEVSLFQLLHHAGYVWTTSKHRKGMLDQKKEKYSNYILMFDFHGPKGRAWRHWGRGLDVFIIKTFFILDWCVLYLGSRLDTRSDQRFWSPWKSGTYEKKTNECSVNKLFDSNIFKVLSQTYSFQHLHSDRVHRTGCGHVQDDAVNVRPGGPFTSSTLMGNLCDVFIMGVTRVGVGVGRVWVGLVSPVFLAFAKAVCGWVCGT